MTAEPTDKRPPRRRRRRRTTPPPEHNVTAVLKQARPAVAPLEADVPLTAQEAARMKEHLAFLRANRRLFKLKVNATEDLLLNGKREPTHRGICLHLLAKVERARVLAASEQLPAKAATELLAGVIRFAPELPYILRFLECVRASETTERASAALSQALQGLDFEALSKAQTRQVLSLILETFPKQEWPGFVLELLDKPAFRLAFDRSSEDWPLHLTELLVPLRAVHRMLQPGPGGNAGGKTGGDSAPGSEQVSAPGAPATSALLAGVAALLAVPIANLGHSLAEPKRQCLLQLGAQALRLVPGNPGPLLALFDSCHFASAEQRSRAAHSLGSALLASDHERAARQLLQAERERLPPAVAAWIKLLDQPRLGPLAVQAQPRPTTTADVASRPGRGSPAALPAHRWLPAWHVPSQQSALVRVGEPGDRELFEAQVQLWRSAWLPQVSPLLAWAGRNPNGAGDRPYLAVQQPGRNFLGRSRQRVQRRQWLAWSLELCALLRSLAQVGVALSDAKLARFSVDPSERLWLVDLWGASTLPAEVAAEQHARLAKTQIEELARSADAPLFSQALLERLQQAEGLTHSMQLLLEAC